MMRTIKLTGLTALSLVIASAAFAGDANTAAMGTIDALDANPDLAKMAAGMPENVTDHHPEI